LRGEQERADEALELYRRAIAADSEHLGARRALAEHAESVRDFLQAKEHYETLVRLLPREVDAHRALASVLVQLGDDARAAVHFEQALELEPLDFSCIQELCACWFRQQQWGRIGALALPHLADERLPHV